ncbi:hypothetical protein BDV19DRAFT_250774 [Aspergillus venezuelensis]
MAFWIWIWIFGWRTLAFFLTFLKPILSEHGERVSSLKMLALIPVAFCSHFMLWGKSRLHISQGFLCIFQAPMGYLLVRPVLLVFMLDTLNFLQRFR